MNRIYVKLCALGVLGLFVLLTVIQSGVAPGADDWSTEGNSISSSDFLGSTNDEDLVIKTNDNERMRITSGGSVGIGTSSPSSMLDVDGTVEMTGFKLTTSPTNGYVLTSDASGVGTWQSSMGGSGATNYVPRFYSNTILTDSIIYATSSKIGIGTTGPDMKLDILDGTGSSQLRLTYTDGSVYTDIGTSSDGNLVIAPSGGKVGIGQTTMQETLTLEPGSVFVIEMEAPPG
jgi:hypothetical protein